MENKIFSTIRDYLNTQISKYVGLEDEALTTELKGLLFRVNNLDLGVIDGAKQGFSEKYMHALILKSINWDLQKLPVNDRDFLIEKIEFAINDLKE